MDNLEKSVQDHYGSEGLVETVLTNLRNAGVDVENLTREDLAQFEEFHSGGRAATRLLAEMAEIGPADHVLDSGCGVGGPARTLAAEFGAKVTGVDLTEAFCEVATDLTSRVGLAGVVDFHQGSSLDLPFDDGRFDVVWMQNSAMNIQDMATLYSEVKRVLRPGGRFAFQETFAGEHPLVHFPVMWAADASMNFLSDLHDSRRMLTDAGLVERVWVDFTEESRAEIQARLDRPSQSAPRFNQATIGQTDVALKNQNGMRNIEEHRATFVRGVFERT